LVDSLTLSISSFILEIKPSSPLNTSVSFSLSDTIPDTALLISSNPESSMAYFTVSAHSFRIPAD
jgi:hypothetical protein